MGLGVEEFIVVREEFGAKTVHTEKTSVIIIQTGCNTYTLLQEVVFERGGVGLDVPRAQFVPLLINDRIIIFIRRCNMTV